MAKLNIPGILKKVINFFDADTAVAIARLGADMVRFSKDGFTEAEKEQLKADLVAVIESL